LGVGWPDQAKQTNNGPEQTNDAAKQIKFCCEQTNILKSCGAPLGVFVADKTEEQLMIELTAFATLFASAFCAALSVLCVLD
jgi:hypothetical protein